MMDLDSKQNSLRVNRGKRSGWRRGGEEERRGVGATARILGPTEILIHCKLGVLAHGALYLVFELNELAAWLSGAETRSRLMIQMAGQQLQWPDRVFDRAKRWFDRSGRFTPYTVF
ncbi:hypothetical protein Droror1_Dr00025815 [Drosera rotundifolia]